ncbi:MAG: HU family DNA-binding protein, partial [Magnetococcales bacterium]|nr:HU family DNA-binding protein [Magnetococcales bacterium]
MNKTELIDSVAQTTGLTKTQAKDSVQAALNAIENALKSGDQVNLIGFGSFLVSTRAARSGRNPQTGKTINIAESKLPRFRPGKALKD